MPKFKHLSPASQELIIKISILKSMMYCGVLWGLYHQGWAIKSDHDGFTFPFWLNGIQAHSYAKIHWPNYTPRKITPQDFQQSLLPTLSRLNVTPAIFNSTNQKLKLSTQQMRHFFFQQDHWQTA